MSLLSVEAVASALGISRVGVARLIRRGELPVVRIGRRVLVQHEDLDAFVAARRQRANGRLTEATA